MTRHPRRKTDEPFPPKLPCPPGECVYGECGGRPAPYGCGGCCRCFNSCHLEWDVEQAYIPETREEYEQRVKWQKLVDRGVFNSSKEEL